MRISDTELQTLKWSSSEGRLKRSAGAGWWKKADFVWKINFNFVEPHNPFLLDSVGRALDA